MSNCIYVLGGRAIHIPQSFGIMGIVNCTPDSFYTPSRCSPGADAVTRALALRDQGADILDLGGESSRPGSSEIPAPVEIARLLPLVQNLRHRSSGTILSLDTWKAKTAAVMLEAGVEIINDISATAWDPELLDVLVQYKPGYVLMHSPDIPKTMQNAPAYADVVDTVLAFFERMLARLTAAGLPEKHILLDPGIGFGKNLAHNRALLQHIDRFHCFGRPLLVGLSMKSLFADLLGLELHERGWATQLASALLWEKGVFWHRVHDVRATRQALILAENLCTEHK